MNYTTLGKTGLRVSEISLGTVEIGLDYGIRGEGLPDEAEASRLLNFALDQGINFIDTARVYGESEGRIGRALYTRRGEFVIVSKAQAGPPEQIRQSVHESLRNLQTDVIDVLMLHSATLDVIEKGEAAAVLEDLRSEGLTRFIGVSVYGPEAAAAAIASGAFSCIQLAYSPLDRRPEQGIGELAKQGGVGLIARSVLLKGALTGKSCLLADEFRELKEAIQVLNSIAEAGGIPLPELAYRYVLRTGIVESALVVRSNNGRDLASDPVCRGRSASGGCDQGHSDSESC